MRKSEDVAILMKNINYIIGSEKIETMPLKTFSDTACDFLKDLSSEIMKSKYSRQYSDLMSVAFWCRKANIQKKKELFGNTENYLGRGVCFHITPSNIPLNFIFSYFFGLLAGNANIVRIPSKDFPQISILLDLTKKIISKYLEIQKRTTFVKYERDNEITENFSKIADCRMIWGGDKTIAVLKSIYTKPRCVDITFADRYSVCIIDGNKILDAEKKDIKRLAENFYNDTYLMDQNACSSPQLIYWINDSKKARAIFWEKVLETAKAKYQLQDAVVVDKYTKFCEDAIDHSELIDYTQRFENILYKSELKKLNSEIEILRGNSGYFYEYSLKNIEEFYTVVNEKYQTITYFGIDAKQLANDIILHNLKGIDRIVPVGKAMDIDSIWDGHDIIKELSRRIDVS